MVHYSVDIDGLIKRRTTPDAKLAHVARALRVRGDDPSVQCTGSEVCASTKGAPFCYDEATGNFHDVANIKGNLLTGDYTLPDGRRGNLYSGPHPVPDEDSSSTASTTAASAGPSPTSAPAAKATSASPAATGSAAAAASSSTAKPATNAASTANSGSVLGGLFVLLFAGLL